jgi:ubiquinone/menaquinone biosynthesis C-methylase UbiE
MEGSYPSKLRLLSGWPVTVLTDRTETLSAHGLSGPHQPGAFASRLFACEALNPVARTVRSAEALEPYSLQWFLDIENQRHSRQGRWIPRLLEFAKHPGETLLGLGLGLGTDWLQYARHGALVVVCSPSVEQLTLIRRNFELRGLAGQFLHAAAASLPLETASIDVACISHLLHEVDNPQAVVDEVYRVLRPGGKALVLAPAQFDIHYWMEFCFPWQRWLPNSDRLPAQEAIRFTGRGLRQLFSRFVEHRVYKRQLRRAEVPHLWRWVPLPVLERLLGHSLVLKAFKPLSAAIHAPAKAA